ncbi:mycofactocin biosynthesis peptidyl-dipeptidase MftE [Arthrobacter zhaoxinii]|uniref:Mycofactocin biosynthesis peptidyl-dipeptidase MftE n=1 Tax=Arthrobacter zhaoxinii TaxID=2964616 RepID=A0ABY5YTS9_9MICC|nr:mycofactocin biosynthesis peptidyl-dipeptidase MftE [Arthrobacter zhaoxinii]UWX98526.1 mycofactocin biosynthesis peptidyl-dipeptidase MftE [Arthrobacter zhaoxinii]
MAPSAPLPPSSPPPWSLAARTWPEVRRGATVLVPTGSTEQHGPHLPLDTDTVIAAAVAAEAAARTGPADVVVAPALAYGASGEHQDFPGTVSLGHEALSLMLVELVRSLSTWARRVVFVNAHGGNAAGLVRAVGQLLAENHSVGWVPCTFEPGDAHAGRTETSLMLYLSPGSVHLDRAVRGDTRPLPELMPALRSGGVKAVSPLGVLGDPAGASAAEGQELLVRAAGAVAARLAGAPDRYGCLQPLPAAVP